MICPVCNRHVESCYGKKQIHPRCLPIWKVQQRMLEAAGHLEPGIKAPSFEIPSLSGQETWVYYHESYRDEPSHGAKHRKNKKTFRWLPKRAGG